MERHYLPDTSYHPHVWVRIRRCTERLVENRPVLQISPKVSSHGHAGWLGGHPKLAHHAHVISHSPVLDGFTVPEANEMHVGLSHRSAGRRHAHQGSVMGTVHGQAAATVSPSAINSSIMK